MNKERGSIGLESLLAVVLIGLLSAVVYDQISDYGQRLKSQQAGKQLAEVASAAQQYIRANYATLVATATASSPVTVTTAQMQAQNFLSSSFSGINPFKQTYLLYVREPSAGNLEGVVVTQGGQTPSDPDLTMARAAQLGGPSAGYVPTGNLTGHSDTVFRGAGGGWQFDTAGTGIPTPGGGHLAALAFFEDDQGGGDYLYRVDVPGQPELNQMTVELDMNGNDILMGDASIGGGDGEGVRSINLEDHVLGDFVCGSDDDTEGQIVFDSNNGYYVCRDGEWNMLMEDFGGMMVMDMNITSVSPADESIGIHDCPASKPNAQIFVEPVALTANDTGKYIKGYQFYAQVVAGSPPHWDLVGEVLTDTGSVPLEAAFNRVKVTRACAP